MAPKLKWKAALVAVGTRGRKTLPLYDLERCHGYHVGILERHRRIPYEAFQTLIESPEFPES